VKHLVLVGGGHAHVQVLAAFAGRPLPGWRMTVVAEQPCAPYSGMLPGCIAGDYTAMDMHIDLARLAEAAGAQLMVVAATGIDRQARCVNLNGSAPIPYDLLSLNVGITPDMSGISGAAEHAVPVKPIAGLLGRLDRAEAAVRALDRPAHLAVIGGGAAGIELAIALKDRNAKLARHASRITLVAGSGLAPALNGGALRRVRRALARHDIALVEGDHAAAITPSHLHLASGAQLKADVAFVSTHARLPAWLAATDLPKADNGGIAVRDTLQARDDEAVFASGDCATMVHAPRPRAGVYAVRQGPYLAANLRAAALAEPLKTYRPQKAHLVLLRTGHGCAIGARGPFFSFEGRWLWWLKDRIDRAFMARFT
jgi:pyridine nucleotide-disulfide oxidoreductase family protein